MRHCRQDVTATIKDIFSHLLSLSPVVPLHLVQTSDKPNLRLTRPAYSPSEDQLWLGWLNKESDIAGSATQKVFWDPFLLVFFLKTRPVKNVMKG